MLHGGAGSDTLHGGEHGVAADRGADVFIFNAGDVAAGDVDLIREFDAAAGDTIRLASDVRYTVREDVVAGGSLGELAVIDIAGGGEIRVSRTPPDVVESAIVPVGAGR